MFCFYCCTILYTIYFYWKYSDILTSKTDFSKGEIFWDAQNREHFDYNPGKLVHLDDAPVQDVGIGANILVTVFSFGRCTKVFSLNGILGPDIHPVTKNRSNYFVSIIIQIVNVYVKDKSWYRYYIKYTYSKINIYYVCLAFGRSVGLLAMLSIRSSVGQSVNRSVGQ